MRHIFSQSTTDKVKSAIMEGLLAKAKMSPQAKADKGKGGKKPASANEPQPEFIAGRRINMGGAEFSDGILAILGMSKANQPVVKVLKIFEAKGGERQKYKVGKENERYSRIPTTRDPDTGENEKDRLRREVVDELIAEHHQRRWTTPSRPSRPRRTSGGEGQGPGEVQEEDPETDGQDLSGGDHRSGRSRS